MVACQSLAHTTVFKPAVHGGKRPLRKCPASGLGEAKPGCFQTGGFPLFSGTVLIVSQTLSGLFLVGAVDRPRKRKRTNRESPQTIPRQIGKIPEKSGKSQKEQKLGEGKWGRKKYRRIPKCEGD